MNRAAAFIEKLTEVQRIAGHLLAHLQASEHDKFGSSLPIAPGIPVRLGARRKRRQQIERCVISTFRVAENMGPNGSTCCRELAAENCGPLSQSKRRNLSSERSLRRKPGTIPILNEAGTVYI